MASRQYVWVDSRGFECAAARADSLGLCSAPQRPKVGRRDAGGHKRATYQRQQDATPRRRETNAHGPQAHG